MAFSINEIKSQLQGGGARPSLFEVRFSNPASSEGDAKVQFMCKATSLPASSVGVIPVPYFGRKINVGGVRQYNNWTCTVINDEDFKVRKALEKWVNKINTARGNLRGFSSANPALYKSTGEVTQYGQTGNVLRVYKFEGIIPQSVSDIALSWESGDAIEEYTVDFAIDLWTVAGEIE